MKDAKTILYWKPMPQDQGTEVWPAVGVFLHPDAKTPILLSFTNEGQMHAEYVPYKEIFEATGMTSDLYTFSQITQIGQ